MSRRFRGRTPRTCQTASVLNLRTAPAWLAAYLVAGALNVVGVFTDTGWLATITKPLLMPLLLLYFIAALNGDQSPVVAWVKRALVFSWIGDLMLMGDGDLFFMLGLLGFLGAQICYISGFRAYVNQGPLRGRPWLILPYLVYWVLLIALLFSDLGPMLIPVLIYSFALLAMAVLALGVSPLTGLGGALFLLSDSLIALTALSDRLGDGAGDWIMPTYIVGQLLIVRGVLAVLSATRDANPPLVGKPAT